MRTFYQLCKWSWPKYENLNGGYEDVFNTLDAAKGALKAKQDRGDMDFFIAELNVAESFLSKQFLKKEIEAKNEESDPGARVE